MAVAITMPRMQAPARLTLEQGMVFGVPADGAVSYVRPQPQTKKRATPVAVPSWTSAPQGQRKATGPDGRAEVGASRGREPRKR